jgi:hypothetical protein
MRQNSDLMYCKKKVGQTTQYVVTCKIYMQVLMQVLSLSLTDVGKSNCVQEIVTGIYFTLYCVKYINTVQQILFSISPGTFQTQLVYYLWENLFSFKIRKFWNHYIWKSDFKLSCANQILVCTSTDFQ